MELRYWYGRAKIQRTTASCPFLVADIHVVLLDLKKEGSNTLQVERHGFQQCILGFQTSAEPPKTLKLMGCFL